MVRVAVAGVALWLAAGAVPALAQSGCAADGWDGQWSTDYGPLAIQLDGRSATGSYQPGDGAVVATLDESNCVLTGTWDQPGTFGRAARGPLRLVLNPDGRAFYGLWSIEGSGAQNSWNGVRAP